MKKQLLLTLTMMFASLYMFSQPSTLTVFSEDGDKFWVILNGEKKNQNAQVKVVVPNQTEQFQKMRIIFEDEKIPTLDQSIQFTDFEEKWNDVTYAIKKKSKDKYVLRISSWKPTTGSVRSTNLQTNNDSETGEIETQSSIETSNPDTQDETVTTSSTVKTNAGLGGANIKVNDPNSGMNFSMNVNIPDMPDVSTTTNTTTTTSTSQKTNSTPSKVGVKNSNENKPVRNTNVNAAPAKKTVEECSMAMNSLEFDDAKKSISSKGFEETKLQVAKQVAKNNCLNTTQVKEIIKLFGFEQTKLDFAKLAYDRTVDKKNYYKVGDVFGFSSSVDELNEYIDSK